MTKPFLTKKITKTMTAYFDKKHDFLELYDSKDDLYIRKMSVKENKESFTRSFPAFLIISIVGVCKIKDSCYLDCCAGKKEYDEHKNMTYSSFVKIINEGAQKGLLSIVLTGSGDPNDHPDFERIVSYAKSKGLYITCMTTGTTLTLKGIDFFKKNIDRVEFNLLCGNENSLKSFIAFMKEDIELYLNILVSHLSLDETIHFLNSGILEFDDKDKKLRFRGNNPIGKLDAISLKLYKRKGLGTLSGCVSEKQEDLLKSFVNTLKRKRFADIIFEPCFKSLLEKYIKKGHNVYIPPCEQGRYSAFITEDLLMLPCEFSSAEKYGESLRNKNIEEIFNGKKFNEYRNHFTECKCLKGV